MASVTNAVGKPGGNFNPLSSLGHGALQEVTTDNVASAPMMNNRGLLELSNRIKPPEMESKKIPNEMMAAQVHSPA
jgi:hypothetical protein